MAATATYRKFVHDDRHREDWLRLMDLIRRLTLAQNFGGRQRCAESRTGSSLETNPSSLEQQLGLPLSLKVKCEDLTPQAP